jgi:thioredoxin 1
VEYQAGIWWLKAVKGEKMDELDEIRKRKLKELEQRHLKKPAADKPSIDEPVEVEDGTFDQFVKTHPAAVVDCWAPWCMPCNMIAPTIEKLAKKYAGKVTFGKLNVDENKKPALKYQIMAIPTVLLFKNGELVNQVVGVLPPEALEQKVARLLDR